MNLRRLTVSLVIALLLSALCTWMLSRRIGAAGARHTPDWHYVAPAALAGRGRDPQARQPRAHRLAGIPSRPGSLRPARRI